jgi:hypothetical protein
MKTQPFLTTPISLNNGLALVSEAVDDDRRVADALRALQLWLDALLVLSTELAQPVVADALGHVAALQQALTGLSTSDPILKDREQGNIRARIEPLRRRLLQLEIAVSKHGGLTSPMAV